nr:uncharacterized protein LOC105472946 isoform X2 [Macaca nemestrina]
MPSCEAPTAGTGEISRRQRRCGGPGDDQGAPNKAALGGLEASASLGDRSAKLPVTPHRWRWPMACTDGARVGARARLGIGGIGRRGTFQRMLQSVASSYNLCIAPSNGKGQPRLGLKERRNTEMQTHTVIEEGQQGKQGLTY